MRSLLVVMIHPVSNPVISIAGPGSRPLPGIISSLSCGNSFNHPFCSGDGRDVLWVSLCFGDRLIERLDPNTRPLSEQNDQSMLAGHDFHGSSASSKAPEESPALPGLREIADKVSIVAINRATRLHQPSFWVNTWSCRSMAVDLGVSSFRPGPIAMGRSTLPALLA